MEVVVDPFLRHSFQGEFQCQRALTWHLQAFKKHPHIASLVSFLRQNVSLESLSKCGRRRIASIAGFVLFLTLVGIAPAPAQQQNTMTGIRTGPWPHASGMPVHIEAIVRGEQRAPSGEVAVYSADRLIGRGALVADQVRSGTLASTAYGTCAIRSDFSIRCWGSNSYGQNSISTIPEPVVQLAGGYGHYCALTESGSVFCAGYNYYGQLGDGTRRDRAAPVLVRGLPAPAIEVTSRGEHSCALLENGEAMCWGANYGWQLGDGTMTDSPVPVHVNGGHRFVQLSAGEVHTCGIDEQQALYCWGSNSWGNIGTGQHEPVPARISRLMAPVSEVSTGYYHTCARVERGGLWCWGYNEYGQIGAGTSTTVQYPTYVTFLGRENTAIATNLNNTCAGTSTGALRCWGEFWALGNGSEIDASRPAMVRGLGWGGRAATEVSLGWHHACALRENGQVMCWGRNIGGSNGGVGETLVPRFVPGGSFSMVRGAARARFSFGNLAPRLHSIWIQYSGSENDLPSESRRVNYTVR